MLSVTPELYESSWVKINNLISDWIAEERLRTQIIDEATGVDNPFLTTIVNLNFKAVILNPEVDTELKNVLKDTETTRSYSHFLDLVRQIYLNIDSQILLLIQHKYIEGLSTALGPTPYTHDKKQIEKLMSNYPWLWLLEAISIHTDIYKVNNASTLVPTDYSSSTRRGIMINEDLTAL